MHRNILPTLALFSCLAHLYIYLFPHPENYNKLFNETKFNETIQCLRKRLGKYDPPFDPIKFNKTVKIVQENNKFLYLNLKLDELVIQGVLDFDVVSINFSSAFQLDVHYHFKRIEITSKHLGSINFFGLIGFNTTGKLKLEVLDADLTTSTKYNIEPPLINTHSAHLTLGKINLDITGVKNERIDKEISERVSRFGAKIINLVPDFVSNEISPPMRRFLNERIGFLSFLQFLEINVKPCDV